MDASLGNESRQALGDASNHVNVSNNSNIPRASPMPSANDLYADWIEFYDDYNLVASPEAKKEYFLTAHDLSRMYHTPVWKHGGGPPNKYYRHHELIEESVYKHGTAAIKRKLVARYKRDEKKRLKEERAQRVLQRLQAEARTEPEDGAEAQADANHDTAGTTDVSDGVGAAATTETNNNRDTEEILNMRDELLVMVKNKMSYKFGNDAPRKWRIEVPVMTKATFAALMGVPADVELETFVQNGAYIKVDDKAAEFFAVTHEDDLIRDFYTCQHKIASDVVVRYKPATMTFSASGYGELWWASWEANQDYQPPRDQFDNYEEYPNEQGGTTVSRIVPADTINENEEEWVASSSTTPFQSLIGNATMTTYLNLY